MPALKNAGKNLARLREITAIVVRHGFGGVLGRTRIFEALGFRPPEVEGVVEVRLTAAQRFRLMLVELGPTFVKLGQVLSSRPDLLPPDFVQELSLLQDQVPALPMEHVQKSIEEGLGRKMSELFASVESEPLASASIAQVHGARTIEGDDVVVKVQRPGITDRIHADLDLLYYFAQFMERVVAETGISTPTGIVEEFEHSLKSELDFLHEASNVRQFGHANRERAYVVIPKVYDELSCRTVLTLERLRGRKISQCEAQSEDTRQVVRNLIESTFSQLFVDGFFHGDPHPGNIFVLEGNRIGFVDFGLVGRMSHSMQETVIILCLAVALKDPDTVARLIYKSGIPGARINLTAMRADIAEIIDRYIDLELKEVQSNVLVRDLLQLAIKYGIKVPKDYAVLIKTSITIEGVVRKLYPELDILGMATPYAKRLLYDRASPKSASGAALRTLLQVQTLAGELPMQLSQILLDMEGGRFSVEMKSDALSSLVGAVRWLGIVVFLGLISAALIVGSFIVIAPHVRWQVNGVPIIPAIALTAAAGLFGGALTWTMLAGRIQKISLRRLFGRTRKS
jgi:ubiquinone biosynthesis protein